MKSKRAYKISLKVIAILSVVICGSTTATSIANVPESETKKHDTSVKGGNADIHPVGDLTIAQGQQLTGDEVGYPRSIGKGRKLKGQQLIGDEIGVPQSKGNKRKKLKTKSKGWKDGEINFDNKAEAHGSQAESRHDKTGRPRKK